MAKKKVVFRSRNQKRDTKLGYLFLLPWIIGVVAFSLIPMIQTFIYSFTNITYTAFGTKFDFVGFTHYTNAFLSNLDFPINLLKFIALELSYVPIILIISFILAMILNSKIKGRAFFRTVFFLPVIILSGALITMLFKPEVTSNLDIVVEEIQSPIETSFIYLLISQYSEPFAKVMAFIYDNFVLILWFTGIPIILFINGLQKINRNLYEAAQIDGANAWQILWKVTIPIVRPIAAIIAVFSIIQLSVLPVSDLYTSIIEARGNVNDFGRTAAYSFVYAIAILLLIGIFVLFLAPREKKEETVIMYTQKKQLDITLSKIEDKEGRA